MSREKTGPSNLKHDTAARIEALESRPRRHPVLHWTGFALSVLSFILLLIWLLSARGSVPRNWILFDIGLGIVSAVEFFTRSGFRWNRAAYLRTRYFDFIAIVPALALVNHGIALQNVWVWLILVARGIRIVDRFLGDGFVTRNILALVEGFQEEITDRVLERIISRLQTDMDRVGYGHGVAKAFEQNRSAILERVKAAHPQEGLLPDLAHIVGLDAALQRAEERTFDAILGIIDSEEIDKAVRDAVNSSFDRLRSEIGRRTWLQHVGIHPGAVK